ncbi:MAG TPA: serine hydroxymethyltransferase [Nitrospirae bacterium]|nr:serine hydroxymethyltransferase [Nitrospirota bacterium]
MEEKTLKETDKQVYEAICRESERENENILLIASENYVSPAVLESQGSIFTNKYAEGYPHKRYYGGCENADTIETLAIERAKELFGVEHVNVQPHSGSQANMAVYFSVLKPGDVILGMDLSHGGHLSHGSKVSFSGTVFNSVFYGVNRETGYIDYDEVRSIAKKHRPRMIVAGASAYSRIIDFEIFSDIAREVDAYLMADIAHIAGLVVGGIHPSPVPYADFVTTTTHKTLRGPRGGLVMCKREFARAIDRTIFPGIQGGPLVHTIAAKAVALKEALDVEFSEYQKNIVRNAQLLAGILIEKGYNIVSGGTDNHLMLVNLNSKEITGKEADEVLERAGITINKNAIPYDEKPPTITSGIRIGTPCVTTRGMGEKEMYAIAGMIDEALNFKNDNKTIDKIRHRARELCLSFRVYNLCTV